MMNTIRNIPFFNYRACFFQHKQEYMESLQDALNRGAYIMQEDLAEFEKALAEYLGVKHAIGTADGTMALIVGMKAAGIGVGDEVIVPSHTFVASVAAIHHVGASPMLADCGRDHLIDPASIESLITKKTSAIMPVHLNGRTADMDSLNQIAKRYNLLIVEDACQALGATYNSRFAGTFGIIGAFSFYPSKTLGCFGDGGALVTDDDDLAKKIKLYRDHGRNTDGKVTVFGYNARLDNLQAAILNVKLKYYDREILRRRELASLYNERLMHLKELVLPPAPNDDTKHFDIFQNYEIEAERRDELRDYLKNYGISTILQWGGYTVHQFKELKLESKLPYTDKMTQCFMLLPMNTSLTDEDIDYICEKIISFYEKT